MVSPGGQGVYREGFPQGKPGAFPGGRWAISRDEVEALREELAAMREDKSTTAAEKDYESIITVHGAFLGSTDPDGKLEVTFDTAGGYLLVTAKKGYIPGFTPLVVRDMPQPKLVESESQSELR